uniref:FIST C-domain domain-containing protein n=1 Tax=Aureoumbra lagunensis TaxID=44058 RepID=A0A7S3K3S2_9STRA|mmetsp:Transcript_10562/g.15947  ORF Transcript_10562/g.15947 Transcript_10562/m.15947 type:complete len:570 (-) Transcript_10562:417-2126(-)|eukprot:CAMPEP_0197322838 /NCGR_PEP_ID=MMETSP0891-20130614/70148_1 /TAXON_ID=44058 ORGANISM="Aureoumbra lagunensis, Strain CCMP1510" /NCGR_SAMPLE_ID=MMETSP0891 /ASSEMBLY_ACC=CAM_ASM_000534 /LENGTH=569 /DNA_ID=CAMNT_0042815339 /DNA_START=1893 /DNA_END=3602 /DNA_ORIENTATION=+
MVNNEYIWEIVLSYLARPQVAVNKASWKATTKRAERPYFMTVWHHDTFDEQNEEENDEAGLVRRSSSLIARFLLRRVLRRNVLDYAKELEVVDKMLKTLSVPSPPHLVLIFVSGKWSNRLIQIRKALRFRFNSNKTVIAGGASRGLICARANAQPFELESEDSGIVLAVIRLAQTEDCVSMAYVPCRIPHALDEPVINALSKTMNPRLILVLGNEYRASVEAVTLANEYANTAIQYCAISGGILGCGKDPDSTCQIILDGPLQNNDAFPRVLPSDSNSFIPGAIVLALGGQLEAVSAGSRGAKLVGPFVYKISQVEQRQIAVCPGHSILLDSIKKFQCVAQRSYPEDETLSPCEFQEYRTSYETVRELLRFERTTPRTILLGVKPNNNALNPNGFALLIPQSVDEDSIIVDASKAKYRDGHVATGDLVAWHTLSAEASRTELRLAARACREHLMLGSAQSPLRQGLDESLSVLGGIVFSCCGRGRNFHGRELADSSAIRSAIPDIPLIGIFANAEIGPPLFNEWSGGPSTRAPAKCDGYTCQASILRLDGVIIDHPPSDDNDDQTFVTT